MNKASSDNIISEDSDILIVLDTRKRWLTKAVSGKQFHSHKGFFDFDSIIGKSFGTRIKTSKNDSSNA